MFKGGRGLSSFVDQQVDHLKWIYLMVEIKYFKYKGVSNIMSFKTMDKVWLQTEREGYPHL